MQEQEEKKPKCVKCTVCISISKEFEIETQNYEGDGSMIGDYGELDQDFLDQHWDPVCLANHLLKNIQSENKGKAPIHFVEAANWNVDEIAVIPDV